MATPVNELELPYIDVLSIADRDEARRTVVDTGRRHWLARTPIGFMLTRYEDVVAVLRDRRWHSAVAKIVELSGVQDPQFTARRRSSILSTEGDEHGRLRRLVAPAFTPKAADRLRPYMREVVSRLLEPFASTGSIELVHDLCEPYPIPIICRLLGAPEEDWPLFSRWATDILRIFNGNLQADLPAIMGAQAEIDAYVTELIGRRRRQPAEDLLTDLIAAEEAGDRLSTEELVVMSEAVLIAGTDTTRNQLACSVALFTSFPDQWRLLAERPELAANAVEESMRVLGAVRATGRFAAEDVEYRDVVFPAGTLITPSLVAGNYDDSVFAEADRFDLTRALPSPQLTFGSGIHYCLGAWLARAELQEALPLLARSMPDLAVDGAISWKPNMVGIWGPERLPLRFTPA
jgi:cytochrome P450